MLKYDNVKITVNSITYSYEEINSMCKASGMVTGEYYTLAELFNMITFFQQEQTKKEQEENRHDTHEQRRGLIEQRVLERYGTEIKYAYESWQTYEKDFDCDKKLVKAPWTIKNLMFFFDKDADIVTLLKVFDEYIKLTEDFHHVFLEGIETTYNDKTGVTTIEFITGS